MVSRAVQFCFTLILTCWRTHHLGIQDENDYCPVHHGSRIHSTVYEPKGGHPFNGHPKGGPRKWTERQGHSPKVHCTVFEHNSAALELARLLKMRQRTKHINQAFHHFREHVEHQEIIVNATPTDNQMADILTKPLPEADFVRHRLSIMGW